MKIQTTLGTLIHTNNYIVGDDKDVVIIEASANVRDIKTLVAGRKVHAIFITHGHWDHAINVDELQKDLKAKVYLSEKAYEKITSKQPHFRFDKVVGSNLTKDQCVFLEEKEYDFKFIKLICIFTPGHTNCSICLLNEENNILFSGDTLFYQTYGRIDLPTSSIVDMKNSLNKLMQLNLETVVYPGHGYLTKLINEQNLLEDFN